MDRPCQTCGKLAGTHACNPIDINMNSMSKTINAQNSKIASLTASNKQLRQQLADSTQDKTDALIHALRDIHTKAQSHPDYTGGLNGEETVIDEINILAVQALNTIASKDK